MSAKPAPSLDDVSGFLADRFDGPVDDLVALDGGYWSSAFSFRAGGDELVLRVGESPEGYRIDRLAAERFGSDRLPIPVVREIGEGLGRWYAISERHHGSFLEDVDPAEAATVGPMLSDLLDALRCADTAGDERVLWYEDEETTTWREWLRDGVIDPAGRPNGGWRPALEAGPHGETYRRCLARIEALLPRCPERRDVVHGDLLHQNVLLADDRTAPTAVFSWKCSALGDFLYDTAWCTFWGRWHDGIGAVDAWAGTIGRAPGTDLVDASVRHHCYELQIGTSHMGWYVWTNDDENLAWTARRLESLLARGPRSIAVGGPAGADPVPAGE